MSGFLLQAFVYLCAAVVTVPIAKHFGLGSVLGYLVAGIVIGPVVGLVGAEAHEVQEFAEFGVVMMLFVVGLELEPRQLWAMRRRLMGLGGLQVAGTALAVWAAALILGMDWAVGLAIGLVATGSSTAIVLQTLGEKGLLKSQGGQSTFAVLLFQDISVIPILALLPLLAAPEIVGLVGHADHGGGFSLLRGLPVWAVTLVTIGAVALVVAGGHFLSRPLFRFIASAQLREVFTAAALLLVVAIALLMTLVGLSPALGTFLAGVVLANSEYRHELQADVEPFKGLLLGTFFMTVGAGINFNLFFEHWILLLGATVALILLKMAVLWAIGTGSGLRVADRWLFALGLAQVGEFAFVLISFCVSNSVLAPAVADQLLLVVALSMMLTPLLFIIHDRIILPRLDAAQQREADLIDEKGVAIIAGNGRFGQVVNRLLRSNGFETVVLDLSAETIETLSRFGIRSFFGDAARPDLLEAAGLMEAKLLVIAIDDRDHAVSILRYAKSRRPDLLVVSRAYDRTHVYELVSAGSDDVIRETFESAVKAGRLALEKLGLHPHEAEKAARHFVSRDEQTLHALAELYDPAIPSYENEPYMEMIRRARTEEEEMLSVRQSRSRDAIRRAWLPPANTSGTSIDTQEP